MNLTSFTTTILFLLLLLPFTHSAPAPNTTEPKHLQKRGYDPDWAATMSYYRFNNQYKWRPGVCEFAFLPRTGYLNWPRKPAGSGKKDIAIPICVDLVSCKSRKVVTSECPATEDAFVSKVWRGLKNAGVKITVVEVYARLHRLYPDVFTEEKFKGRVVKEKGRADRGGGRDDE